MASSLRAKRHIFRMLTMVSLVAIGGGNVMTAKAAKAVRTWHTDQAKLLDSPELIGSTVRVLKGAVPGTGKPYDAQKVADDLVKLIFAELAESKGPSGVHEETALATLGALAGFSIQMSLRETLVKTGKAPEDRVFAVAKTMDGNRFYLSAIVDEALFGGKPGVNSVYSVVCSGAIKAGAKELPSIRDITRQVANAIGSDSFGVPHVPAAHMPQVSTMALLDKFWNPVRNDLVLNVREPLEWPFVLALAARKVIMMGKGTLDPALAAKLVMETATAMAKIDPARIHNAYFQAP